MSSEYIERVKKFISLLRNENELKIIKKELDKLNKKGHLKHLINYIDPYDADESIDSNSDNYRENYTSSEDGDVYSPKKTITTLTPLAIACYRRCCHSEVLKLLLEYGADIKQRDKYGNDILYHMCKSRAAYKCLKVFFQHIAPDFYKYKTVGLATLKERAALAIPEKTRKAILQNTSDFRSTVISQNIGSLIEQEELVKKLLKQTYTSNKAPCLQIAIHDIPGVNIIEVLQLLLDLGADINGIDKSGKTAAIVAIQLAEDYNKEYPHVLKFLLSKNADINIGFGPDKITPLLATSMPREYAAPYNRFKATLALLEHGADINSVDNNGDTLLLRAIKNKHYVLIDKLLKLPSKYGLDIYIKNKEGKNAHDVANDLKNTLENMELPRKYMNVPSAINIFKEEQLKNIKSLDVLLELPKSPPKPARKSQKAPQTPRPTSPPKAEPKAPKTSRKSQKAPQTPRPTSPPKTEPKAPKTSRKSQKAPQTPRPTSPPKAEPKAPKTSRKSQKDFNSCSIR